jgi:predicted TIM-barrel fold metal-dependent hydrolase
MRALAASPHCYCKLSCLCLPDGPWDDESNRRVVLEAIETFGVERCMFASNFPVDSLCADFDTIFSGFAAIVAEMSDADRLQLFHDNAIRFYRLDP